MDRKPSPSPRPVPEWVIRTQAVCGWPTNVPNTPVTWWCGQSFCHDGPHLLVDPKGRIRASADLFT